MTITNLQHTLQTGTFNGHHVSCSHRGEFIKPHNVTIDYKNLLIAREYVLNKQRSLRRELNGKQFDNAVIGLLGEYAAGLIIAAGADDHGFESFAEFGVKWLSINDEDVSDIEIRGHKLEIKTSTNFDVYGAMVNVNQMGRVMARSSHCIWMEAESDLDKWHFRMRGWRSVNEVTKLPVETFSTHGSTWLAHQDLEAIYCSMADAQFERMIEDLDCGTDDFI